MTKTKKNVTSATISNHLSEKCVRHNLIRVFRNITFCGCDTLNAELTERKISDKRNRLRYVLVYTYMYVLCITYIIHTYIVYRIKHTGIN